MDSKEDVHQARLSQAMQAYSKGMYRRAVRICRRLLSEFGARADVLSLLAMSLYRSEDVDGAIAAYEELSALTQDRNDLTNLAVLYQKQARYAQAERIYRDLLQRAPDAQAWNNLGTVYQAQQKPERAIQAYRASLELEPGKADAQHNLALALKSVRDYRGGISQLEDLLARDPGNVRARFDLASMMEEISQDAAIDMYRALAANSRHAPSWVALGRLYGGRLRYAEARKCLQNALLLSPDSEDALTELCYLLIELNELDEAQERMRRLERRFPESLSLWKVRMTFYVAIADYEEVLRAIERIRQHSPDEFYASGTYLFHIHYVPDMSAQAVFDAHRQVGAVVSKNAPARIEEADPTDFSTTRLRVGFVSPDFRAHAVSRFVLPVLRHRNRERLEVFCYAEDLQRDAVTDEIEALADVWRSTVKLSDYELARLMRQDGIEILIDLSGYTGRTRITVFALKPAPIQVSWLGYPDTTGLPEMDYRITDPVADPEPESDRFYTESLIRMQDVFLSYEPAAEVAISAAPCETDRHVTFASFNNRAKHNESVVALWSEILRDAPDSRLLLKDRHYARPETVERIRQQFEEQGVERGRLEFIPYVASIEEHLALYNRVDIALDPFPYNGTTTSCDALWMGVPIVCLYGDRHSARVTASLLTHLGMTELVAAEREAYRKCAVELARDRERIKAYRRDIRSRFLRSKLGDGKAFTREFETVLEDLRTRTATTTGR